MSRWRDVTLADVAERVDYGFTASASSDLNLPRFLRITDIARPSLDWSRVPGCLIDENDFKRYELAADDIVVARTGATVGYAKRIRMHPRAVFASYLVRFRLRGDVDPRFVGAVVESHAYKRWVQQNAGGAAQPNASAKVLGAFPFSLPDRPTQARVGAVFDTIDALIENNRRRVEVLEEMARAIYREWFVKFRYPGYEDVPLVDSALGPIPVGWEVHPFSAIVEYHIGGGWGTEQEGTGSAEPAYVIRGTDIPRVAHSDVTTVPFRFHRESNLRSRKLRHGDIVLEVSGGSKGQPVGRSLLIRQSLLDAFDAPTMCASFCKLVRVNPAVAEPGIVFLMLQEAYANGQLDTFQVQSTGITNFRWKPFLQHFKVPMPPRQQQKELVQVFDRLGDLAATSGRRIVVLTQIRDMLLPKLVSGQLDVSLLDLSALVADRVE
ncbi:restriction endonuclease subunit S [Gordonia hongkongensis]|uniref:restriction endonuclease subunit S n=1 Tax=Gordonia hongkongensis TaxID=1701090 RepID=UPI001FFB07FB|nr:restriction endonuclease subunit S [Gordonia hongkongensis]UPG68378.1 restriction endonuclease subunit S [Gordonia hongkongensis]